MTSLELLDILGGVKGSYILQAQEQRSGRRKRAALPYLRQIAAIAALILILTAFTHTTPGAAAVEYVKEKISGLIETLFPPKKMTIFLEGMEYEGDYAADGLEPGSIEDAKPGFAIYYDVDHYTMVTEGDTTYIRPYQKPLTRKEILTLYADEFAYLTEAEQEQQIAALMEPQTETTLPACEIEILHLDLPCEQAAAQARALREGQWEITETTSENRITLFMLSGHAWDSPVEDWDFFPDGQGGCFRIIRRYFLEATEGHGTRMAAIVNTFTVLPPQEKEG